MPTIVSDGGYQQLDAVAAQDGLVADGWYWESDASELDPAMEIEATTQVQLVDAAAPVAIVYGEFVAEDAYEDPTTDLIESASGPVQANAPPAADNPPEDAPDFTIEVDDDFFDDYGAEDAPDQPGDDAWPWPHDADDSADQWWLDEVLSAAGQQAAIDQSPEDPWQFEDAAEEPAADADGPVGPDAQSDQPPDDPWQSEDAFDEPVLEDGPVGPDAPALLEGAWPWDDHAGDPEELTGTDPVGEDQPPLPADDWLAEEVDDDAWWADTQAPLVDAQVDNAPPQDQSDFDDAAEDWAPTDDGPVGPDAAVAVDVVLQDEPEFAQDVGDELLEDSGPVVADVVAADQPADDPWQFDEQAEDADIEVGGPVAEAQADQPVDDQWLWDDGTEPDQADESAPVATEDAAPVEDGWVWLEDATDEAVDTSAPVADEPAADQPPEDAPLFESDLEDFQPQDDYTNEDEPQAAIADAWNWEEEPADDDTWWHAVEHANVDLPQLPGPAYAEAWDFNADDTEDDTWWVEITQPDPAGLPADTCPAQLAAAMARIAELEALLAAALSAAGGGGGGGDDIAHYRDMDERAGIAQHERDRKRAIIEENNRLIIALAGAVVHGLNRTKK